MKTGGFIRALLATVAVAAIWGHAHAQEPAAPAPSAPEPEDLTPTQMVDAAKALLPAMDRDATVVRHQLTTAREQKDVVKALCLSDKLTQIDLAIKTANDRVDGLESAVKANDVERARYQYTVVLVLKDRVTTLVSESNQCIGEETGFVGESAVTVEVEGVPGVDPSLMPESPLVNQPPVATPPPAPEPPSVTSPSMPNM